MKNKPKKKNETLKATVSILLGVALIAIAAYAQSKKQVIKPAVESDDIALLQAEMAGAVALEDYKYAAQIRDKINELKNKQHDNQPTTAY